MASGQFCVVKVDVGFGDFMKFFWTVYTLLYANLPHLSGEHCKLVTHKVKIIQKSNPFLDFFKALSVCKTIGGHINCNWKPQDFA